MTQSKQPAPRPGIMDIAAYVGGDGRLPGHDNPIRLASNEGALGPSPKAIEAYEAAGAELHRYPDGGYGELRRALSEHHGIPADRIVCSNGSDELISLLTKGYAGPGDEVLFSAHGFAMYPIATMAAGATPVTAPEIDLTADVDGLLERVTERTRIVFLANPNNPTGTYVPAEAIRRLHAGLRPDILLVIDAAYAEFVTRNDYSSGMEMVAEHRNVVVTRTFSKAYALAGLRLGWAYCPESVAGVLNRLRGPFNVALPTAAAGIAALRDVAHLDMVRTHNDEWLPWFREKVAAVGLEALPSFGNFVLVRFPDTNGKSAAAADAFLRGRGILVRRVDGYRLPDCLRVTIGLERELRATSDALAAFMAE